MALLALLEVIFGVAWAWLGANEAPSVPVLGGGALVLAALAGNKKTEVDKQDLATVVAHKTGIIYNIARFITDQCSSHWIVGFIHDESRKESLTRH